MKIRKILALAALLCTGTGGALANNCAGYTFTLMNGTLADASQVMVDFNNILSCANNNLAHSGVNSDITNLTAVTNLAHSGANSDITSLSALTTPLSVAQGGTGSATAAGARTNIGLGTAAIENLLNSIVDDGSGNLSVGNSGVAAGSYTYASITVGADGRITTASNGTSPGTAASAPQMEGSAPPAPPTDNGHFASPMNLQYSPYTIKAWVEFFYSGGVLNTIASQNCTISRSGVGLYTITIQGGQSFSHGFVIGMGNSGGSSLSFATDESGDIVGINPSIPISVIANSAGLVDPTNVMGVTIVGATGN